MGKKTERIRHLVNKLAARYGEDDVDVVRLKVNLDELQEVQISRIEQRDLAKKKFDFRTDARRVYQALKGGDLH